MEPEGLLEEDKIINHFDNFLNIRKLILEKRPELIVECGAGEGETTRMLAHLKLWYPFELVSITDKLLPYIEEVEFRIGLSYEKLKEFDDASIGMCLIDTDHNYWTLWQELEALIPKMKEGGLVLMHDVETFYHNTGMGMSYWNDQPYPEEAIRVHIKDGGLGDALIDFLHKYRGFFKLLRYDPNEHGMAVIEKRSVTQTLVITPGTKPVYAKPVCVPSV
jgi:hypothetical protein